MAVFAKRTLLCASASLVSLLSAPALAQQAAASAPGTSVSEVIVTAQKLDAARASIQPQIGASTYTIDAQAIEAMPGGDNAPLNQVVLQTPGVAQDSFGQLHIRGEHNGLQFRLNGVILPEGLSVFSQALSPRLADNVELITGALPAEYGLRTAGIIDITTKSGVAQRRRGLDLWRQPRRDRAELRVRRPSGNLNYFVSGSYLQNDLGIELPDGRSNPIHDQHRAISGLCLSGRHPRSDDSQVPLILGASDERFQIPDLSGQPELVGRSGTHRSTSTARPLSQPAAQRKPARDHRVRRRQLPAHDRPVHRPGLAVRPLFDPDSRPTQLRDSSTTAIAQTADKTDLAGGLQAEGVYH